MFYTYSQNNSGGKCKGPALYVIIEADSAKEANERAISEAGLYFDGVADGIDCECCGDRWRPKENLNMGDRVPMLYSEYEVSEESEPVAFDRVFAKQAGAHVKIYRK
jgi:hypothetical protein